MLKVTAVSENTIKGEYTGTEVFESTSELMVAVLNRPAIDFYIRSRADGRIVCERYLKPNRVLGGGDYTMLTVLRSVADSLEYAAQVLEAPQNSTMRENLEAVMRQIDRLESTPR